MPTPILMPALSPTMETGTLARWLVKEGDTISAGDIIAEIETDKATMEFEAVEEGTLGRILIPEGTDDVAVNVPIAMMLDEGEDAAALDEVSTSAPAPAAKSAASEAAPATASPASEPVTPVAVSAPKSGDRIVASPLARRMAQSAGLDLAQLAGSGPHGRIIKVDVEQALAAGGKAKAAAVTADAAPAAPAASGLMAPPTVTLPQATSSEDAPYEEIRASKMRQVIAARMTQAKQWVPHFYLTMDVRVDALLELRKTLNAKLEAMGGGKVSVNDLIIKATALALRKVPELNASWAENKIIRYRDVDIAIAVATDGGLITPVIRKADSKGLATIGMEMIDLAARAREGKLDPSEYQGGGFSLSNLGMFGVKQFEAIINPPQAGILAVGASEQRPVVMDGALGIATMMTATVSVDHRAADGVAGAKFLDAFKGIVEEPLTMML